MPYLFFVHFIQPITVCTLIHGGQDSATMAHPWGHMHHENANISAIILKAILFKVGFQKLRLAFFYKADNSPRPRN